MPRSFDELLSLTGSETRASVLVQALQGTPDPDGKRELLTEWFNLCDALAPWREQLRAQCELAGFFSDVPDIDWPELPVTVYRAAWEDDEIEQALSWTTSREVAERFARILTGPRGWFLGLSRDDVEMYVWQGTCHAAYGYLNGRDEQELVACHVIDIQPIAALRKVEGI